MPVIWAGVEVQRFGLQARLEEVIRATKLPWTTDLLGKSVLSEDHPGFKGVFDGASAVKNVMDLFNASNWVLGLGNLVTDDFADWVQGHYDNLILAYNNTVRVGKKTFDEVPLAAFMERLVERLEQRSYRAPAGAAAVLGRVPTPAARARVRLAALAPAAAAPADDRVTYNRFFARMQTLGGRFDGAPRRHQHRALLGRRAAGARGATASSRRRPGTRSATPRARAVGVGYAAPDKRAVVFCGDGGFQEIAQAASDIVRSGHDATVFVFNNALYGIEQAFVDPYYFVPDKHGKRHPPEPFDLLHPWSYAKLTEVFGGGWGATVETMTELEAALETAKTRPGLSLIDLRVPQDSITLQMLQQAGVTPDPETPLKLATKRPSRKGRPGSS